MGIKQEFDAIVKLYADHLLVSIDPDNKYHLQERVLGEDGQPRKMKDGEDPFHLGLVLEWVFGTIVSTAEKARDGAKRMLGMLKFCPAFYGRTGGTSTGL